MGCRPLHVRRASSLMVAGPQPGSDIDADEGLDDFSILFQRAEPSPVEYPRSASWVAEVPSVSATILSPLRGAPTDTLTLAPAPVGGWTVGPGAVLERKFISEPLKRGLTFGAATAWAIQLAGNATPNGTMFFAATLRVFASSGAHVIDLMPLTVGPAALPGSNNYQTYLVRVPLAAYTTVGGERLQLETGPSSGGGQWASVIGSRAQAFPSIFELSNHVMGFSAGNPGQRCPYIELDGVGQ